MDLDTILNLLADYNLTADELLVVYMAFISQREENDGLGHSEYFAKWYSNGGHKQLHDIFESLKQKGFVQKDCKPSSPTDIEFNKTFIKGFMKHSDLLGQELWDTYPDHSIRQGIKYDWKNISKRFTSREALFFFYGMQIKNNIELHDEILKLIKWAKENNRINCGIVEFVISHKWEQWKKERDSGDEGMTVDSIMIYE